jgi:hypothetical protein
VTVKTGFGLDIGFIECLYTPLRTIRDTVHRYTLISVLSLHLSYPGDGFLYSNYTSLTFVSPLFTATLLQLILGFYLFSIIFDCHLKGFPQLFLCSQALTLAGWRLESESYVTSNLSQSWHVMQGSGQLHVSAALPFIV